MSKGIKMAVVAALLFALVVSLCACGLLTPPIQSEIEAILAEDPFYAERGLTIESVEFFQGQTNKFQTQQRVDFFAVTSSNEEYRLTEMVLLVFQYSFDEDTWTLTDLEHQDPQYEYVY